MLLSENGYAETDTTKIEENIVFIDDDKTAESRKQDHIELAFKAQVKKQALDTRFYYEPMLAAHPSIDTHSSFQFLGKTFQAPLWVSSMTGGTAWAHKINYNLARAAHDFGFGMGLGSCRSLLTDSTHLADFAVRSVIGDDLPLYANLGVAQIEQLLKEGKLHLISELIDKLEADGLIVHVNPMQEALQPEGDQLEDSPLVTLNRLIDALPHLPIIVKEVGQGMGYHSLKALLQLPLQAIDFAASGGTNFALLELLRSNQQLRETFEPLTRIGHSAEQMVLLTNQLKEELGNKLACKQVIISGGIQTFLDGYHLIHQSKLPAIYGQASAFLKHARGSYEELYTFVEHQIKGLRLAQHYLRVR